MIHIKGLRQTFGDRDVLKDIDLNVAEGELLAIMGSSGGGKTTLLRCISGLLRATAGQVRVDGVDVRQDPEEARRHMGMVFQSAALFDYMDVESNVLFGVQRRLQLSAKEGKALVAESLQRVGLEGNERKMPSELSGGMRKRVGIARALALRPRIMLYDEPTTGLDPITTYTIDALMRSLCNDLGMTSLVVSHDVSSVFRVADRIAFLHGGELVFDGTPAEFRSAEHKAIRELVQKSQATEFGTAT
jgi:phospholipid/cholesterol/gamma-HCH transport system ATP-binding protein